MQGDTKSEYLSLSVIASNRKRFLPLSTRRLRQMCEAGVFKTAFKPGTKRGMWYILRSEILAHKFNNHQPRY